MRIRLRLFTGVTKKLELSEGLSVAQLQQRIAQELGLSSEVFRLSLNKQTVFYDGDNRDMKSAGIRSGDLVWVLLVDPSAEIQAQPLERASESLREYGENPEMGTTSAQHDSPVEVGEPDSDWREPFPLEKQTDDQSETTQPEGFAEQSEISTFLAPNHVSRVFQATNLSALAEKQSRSHRIVLLALHAAMFETGFVPAEANQDLGVAAIASSDSSFFGLRYSLPPKDGPASTEAECLVKASILDRFLILYGVVAGAEKLDTRAIKIDALAATDVPSDISAAGNSLSAGHRIGPGSFRDLRGLWAQLKDELCVPLLTGACRASGRPLPPALLTLPAELKEACLRDLPPADLAAAMCVCTELRHVASANALWRPHFERDFPGERPAPGLPLQPAAVSWHAAYCARAEQRRRFKALRRYYPGGRATPRPPPAAPFLPRGPAMPGFAAGGDYDRLPACLLPNYTGAGGVGLGMLGGAGYRRGGRRGGAPGFPFT